MSNILPNIKWVKKLYRLVILEWKNQPKKPISIYDANMDRIVVSNMVLFGKKGFKYFIGYGNDSEKIISLLMPPKISAHRKDFKETKYMIKDKR